MIRKEYSLLIGVVSFILTLFLVAKDLNAQVPTINTKGKVLSIVEIIEDDITGFNTIDVFTVQENRRLVITDLLVSGSGGSRILRDGSPATIGFKIAATGGAIAPYSHTFATGIEFTGGEIVAIRHEAFGFVSVYLRGYLTEARE